ncbi:MAG: RagB/SusD family nutrient uptake outer membrane protein, partial [Bacteroidota bacterium]|nr:RagB/SusD family nutrient uptake outer membrane protein [Bacteroidota bacterium]
MEYKRTLLKIFMAIAIFYSCNKDRLNQSQLGELDITALQNKRGVEGLLIGAYSMLDGISGIQFNYGAAASNWIYGSVCGSEAYKGGPDLTNDQPDISSLETFKSNSYNSDLAQKWAAVYDGIAKTNEVLRVMRKAKDMSVADTMEVRAEALFLRAHYHFEAKKIWNNI